MTFRRAAQGDGWSVSLPDFRHSAETTSAAMSAWAIRTQKPLAFLEAWLVIGSPISFHLVGVVFNHARLPDRSLVVTSDLRAVDILPPEEICVETLNTLYVLGDACSGDPPLDYREIADELLGEPWQVVDLQDILINSLPKG